MHLTLHVERCKDDKEAVEKSAALKDAFQERFEDAWGGHLEFAVNSKPSTFGKFGKDTFMELDKAKKFVKDKRENLDAVTKGTKCVDVSDGSPCVLAYPRKGSFEVWYTLQVEGEKKLVACGLVFTRLKTNRWPEFEKVLDRVNAKLEDDVKRHHEDAADEKKAKAGAKMIEAHHLKQEAEEKRKRVENSGKATGSKGGRRASVVAAAEAAGAAVLAAAAAAADAAKGAAAALGRSNSTDERLSRITEGTSNASTRASTRTSTRSSQADGENSGGKIRRAKRRSSVVHALEAVAAAAAAATERVAALTTSSKPPAVKPQPTAKSLGIAASKVHPSSSSGNTASSSSKNVKGASSSSGKNVAGASSSGSGRSNTAGGSGRNVQPAASSKNVQPARARDYGGSSATS